MKEKVVTTTTVIYTCEFCNETFIDKEKSKKHEKDCGKNPNVNTTCEYCGKILNSKSMHQAHEVTCDDRPETKLPPCPFCGDKRYYYHESGDYHDYFTANCSFCNLTMGRGNTKLETKRNMEEELIDIQEIRIKNGMI